MSKILPRTNNKNYSGEAPVLGEDGRLIAEKMFDPWPEHDDVRPKYYQDNRLQARQGDIYQGSYHRGVENSMYQLRTIRPLTSPPVILNYARLIYFVRKPDNKSLEDNIPSTPETIIRREAVRPKGHAHLTRRIVQFATLICSLIALDPMISPRSILAQTNGQISGHGRHQGQQIKAIREAFPEISNISVLSSGFEYKFWDKGQLTSRFYSLFKSFVKYDHRTESEGETIFALSQDFESLVTTTTGESYLPYIIEQIQHVRTGNTHTFTARSYELNSMGALLTEACRLVLSGSDGKEIDINQTRLDIKKVRVDVPGAAGDFGYIFSFTFVMKPGQTAKYNMRFQNKPPAETQGRQTIPCSTNIPGFEGHVVIGP